MHKVRVSRPRGGNSPGKHAKTTLFNPTPGTSISRGSELRLWSEPLPLIVKLCSTGLAQDKGQFFAAQDTKYTSKILKNIIFHRFH